MKNIKYYIMLAMTMVFAACSQEEDVNVPTVCPQEGERVEITVGVDNNKNSRVSYQDDAPNFKWEQGDQIVVLGFNNVDGQDVCQFAEEFTMKGDVAADGASATFTGILRSAEKIKVFYKAKHLSYDVTQADGKISMWYNDQTQKGNVNTAHLKDYMLIGADTNNEALLKGNLKLSLLNSIMRLDINSLDPALGTNLSNIEWWCNGEKKFILNLTEATAASIKAYFCFDPAQLSVKKGDKLNFYFTGNSGKFAASAEAKEGTTSYQPGHRYFISFAKDAAQNVLGNMEPVRTNNREIWVKSAAMKEITGFTAEKVEGSDWGKYVSTATEDLTTITDGLFQDGDLTACLLPNSVTTIGANAFANCKFTKFEVLGNVTSIGAGAFSGCDALQELIINAPYREGFTTESFNGLNTTDVVLYLDDAGWFANPNLVKGVNCFGHDWKDIKATGSYTAAIQGFPSAEQAESMY